jgi:hypothetical protein
VHRGDRKLDYRECLSWTNSRDALQSHTINAMACEQLSWPRPQWHTQVLLHIYSLHVWCIRAGVQHTHDYELIIMLMAVAMVVTFYMTSWCHQCWGWLGVTANGFGKSSPTIENESLMQQRSSHRWSCSSSEWEVWNLTNGLNWLRDSILNDYGQLAPNRKAESDCCKERDNCTNSVLLCQTSQQKLIGKEGIQICSHRMVYKYWCFEYNGDCML